MRQSDPANLMRVAELRYVQSKYETGDVRGADTFVRHFLPAIRRWRLAWLARTRLDTLRSNPIYYYLIARTTYYDALFCDAVAQGFRFIVNIGCGFDTRSYRFERLLHQNGVKILECDQPAAIADRRRVAKRLRILHEVSYASVDLNGDAHPDLQEWLGRNSSEKVFLMMEGVSPYVDGTAFGGFLSWLGTSLPRNSRVAYDFKLCGVADDFGRGGRNETPFRLPSDRPKVVAYHENRGFRLNRMELSADLAARHLPRLAERGIAMFAEDGLVQLEVK